MCVRAWIRYSSTNPPLGGSADTRTTSRWRARVTRTANGWGPRRSSASLNRQPREGGGLADAGRVGGQEVPHLAHHSVHVRSDHPRIVPLAAAVDDLDGDGRLH